MANYAVRIYDAELKTWLIAEAARRGTGIKTSDIVEAALRCSQGHIIDEGSFTAPTEVSPAPRRTVRRRDASNHGAVPADAVSREAVVQPVPPVDLDEGLVATIRSSVDPKSFVRVTDRNGLGTMVVTVEEARDMVQRTLDEDALVTQREEDPDAKFQQNLMTYAPVPRAKGPDSGPDDELGF